MASLIFIFIHFQQPVLATEKYAFYGTEPPAETLKEEKAHLEAQENYR